MKNHFIYYQTIFIIAGLLLPVHGGSHTKAEIVGQVIWQGIFNNNEDLDYTDSFLQGMLSNENKEKKTLDQKAFANAFFEYKHSQKDYEIQKSLYVSEQYFLKLNKKKNVICLRPNKIYYKRTKAGIGQEIQNIATKIIIKYLIKDLSGKILEQETYKGVPSEMLFPGMIIGLEGMKKNEIRKLFIHSEYAPIYYYDLGKTLVVDVELIDIVFTSDESGWKYDYRPKPLRYSEKIEKNLNKKYQEKKKRYFFELGVNTWYHFKYGKAYSISEVIRAFQRAKNGKTFKLNQKFQNQLLDLQYEIYNQKEISRFKDKS